MLVTLLLGVAAGFLWAALAPRPYLVMTGPGAAQVTSAESSAFIGGDGWYCLICLAGGIISGLAGYLLAVRGHHPVGMALVLLSGLAAGLIALAIGQHSGQASYHHLLSTLPRPAPAARRCRSGHAARSPSGRWRRASWPAPSN